MGLAPKQIKAKKTTNTSWKSQYSESLKVDRSTKEHDSHSVIAGPASATANRSIMANLHKESEETRAAILDKAARVMPLYNKGGLQLLSKSDDLKALNKVAR
jgi:cytochrome c1